MLNFRKLYEIIFKSFNVAADTEMVEQLENDNIEKMIIIKRSWIFGIFISGKFISMLLIMIINIYLIHLNFSDPTESWILMWILVFNMLYWIYSIMIYFSKFRKIYWERSKIVDTKTIKTQLQEWDIAFSKFFNQTIFNYFILIWISIYIIYDLIFIAWFSTITAYGWLNIFLLLTQIYLSKKFKKRMIDLEMDFSIVVPWKIIFYNQSWLKRTVLTINSEKIKTITSSHAKLIWSIFNYWTITIFTEWDSASMGEMTFMYVASPSETVYEINELLGKNKLKEEAKEDNV